MKLGKNHKIAVHSCYLTLFTSVWQCSVEASLQEATLLLDQQVLSHLLPSQVVGSGEESGLSNISFIDLHLSRGTNYTKLLRHMHLVNF